MASKVKPVIAVDIDEVLAHLIPVLAVYHNETYVDAVRLTADSFTGREFHEIWGGTKEEGNEKMENFFDSAHFDNDIHPVQGAYEALCKLKNDFEFHVVTARHNRITAKTLDWLNKHYPNVFAGVHFGNNYMEDGTRRSKDQICRDIGAELLIDDNIVYSSQCAINGTHSLLFGDYSWNRDVALTYIHNWQSFQRHASSLGSNAALNVGVKFHSHSLIEHHFTRLKSVGHNADCESNVYRVASWDQVSKALYSLLENGAFKNQTTPSSLSDNATAAGVTDSSSSTSATDKLVVAAIQMCSVADKQRNLQTIRWLVSRCKTKSPRVQLICLPECCIFMGESSCQTVSVAETISSENSINNEGLLYLCELARECGVWLSVGGFPEQRTRESAAEVAGVDCMSNTHILIDSKGQVVTPVYRKIHLFDSPLANLKESQLTVSGDSLVVHEVDHFKVGLSICYDLSFPALYEALCGPSSGAAGAGGGGAEVVLVPSAFTQVTGKAHWEILLRARAIENQCYVIAAAQSGQHNEKRVSYGHSMIIDPWGEIVAQLNDEKEGIITAEISREKLLKVRTSMPVQTHKRPELYHL